METIKMYLNNMFEALPKSQEVLDIKNELLGHMTDKYNELKNEGKTENEAVGIVISEFGNIDELIKEMGIQPNMEPIEKTDIPAVDYKEAKQYLDIKKTTGRVVGLGVVCILVGVAFLIFLLALSGLDYIPLNEDVATVLGVIILLFFIVAAVGMFIMSGAREEKFKYIEDTIMLEKSAESILKSEYEAFLPTFYLTVAIGVCLCITSVIPVLLTSITNNESMVTMSVCILLCFVASAVFLFIYFGNQKEAYCKLLQIDDYSKERKNAKNDKVIGAIASIVWPITVVVFLIWGFFFGGWGISWIVFPIVGILFGGFSAVYSAIKGIVNE